MRKFLIGLCAMSTLLLGTTSCHEEYTTYNGAEFISFSDSLYILPVQNDEEYFNIPVVASNECDYDRTVGVEVVDVKSNAKERLHYTVESNTLTIPAGEKTTNFRVRGVASNITIADSLGINIKILSEDVLNGGQNLSANVILKRTCPFDINEFTGYGILTSSYMNQYMPGVTHRLVHSELDPDNKNTIIIKDYFYDGYDVKLRFTDNDILNPLIEMDEQNFGSTAEAFGTIYGDGIIRMEQLNGFPSYYSTCENFVVHYMTLFVPEVGVVGQYGNIVEWISDEEAEKIMREGF